MSVPVTLDGQCPESFQPIDATCHRLAHFVSTCGNFRWAATTTALLQTRPARVFALRTDADDLSTSELLTVHSCSIGTIHTQDGQPFAKAAHIRPPNSDLVKQRKQAGRVAGLNFRDEHRERTTLPAAQDVDFAVSPPRLIPGHPSLTAPFFCMAGCFRAPTAARWALQVVLSSDVPCQSTDYLQLYERCGGRRTAEGRMASGHHHEVFPEISR